MGKIKTKFRVGDKVKILPSAIEDGVYDKAYNHIGHITKFEHGSCRVSMDNQELNNYTHPWAVSLCNISPVIEVGQQLLLWEDMFT